MPVSSPPFASTGTRVVRLAALGAFLVIVAVGCGGRAAKAPEKQAPEVVVTTPVADEVADYQDFTGRLDGLRNVDIRPHVSGYVVSAPFKEGDAVKENDVLFLIDPRPFKADLNLAAANLKLSRADQVLQESNAARARSLLPTGAMSREDFDTATATAEKSRANAEAMVATRDRAQLYLDYTKVIAPIGGRISRRLVDPGNLVNADQTVLTSIVSDNQLYAYFDVDERTYLDLVGTASPGQGGALASRLQFPVLLRLANEDEFSRTGVVNFVDNRVNANTGTIRLRAVFDNPTGSLRAGLFVRIRLPVGAPYQALLVPDEAVLSDQGRKYVYVVDANNEVAYRSVTLGEEIKGLRVIRKGVAKRDRVVVSGMQRIKPGAQVHAETQAPPKPPGSPLGKLLSHGQADKETGRQGDKEKEAPKGRAAG